MRKYLSQDLSSLSCFFSRADQFIKLLSIKPFIEWHCKHHCLKTEDPYGHKKQLLTLPHHGDATTSDLWPSPSRTNTNTNPHMSMFKIDFQTVF